MQFYRLLKVKRDKVSSYSITNYCYHLMIIMANEVTLQL